MEQTDIKKISDDLEVLKKAVFRMQDYLEDCFLTPDEEKKLDKSIEEFEKGETTSLEDMEKELDL